MRRPVALSAVSMTTAGIIAVAVGVLFGFVTNQPSPGRAAAVSSIAPASSSEPSGSPGEGSPYAPSPHPSVTPSQSFVSPSSTSTPAPTPTPLTAEQRDQLLQASLDAFRADEAIPGISATVAFPDGTSWTGVGGLADVARKTRVTTGTSFAVASVSKTFLSALILELAHEHRLRLDDRINRYVPDLALDPRITIRQLLDHTSGLGDFFLNPKIDALLLGDRSAIWTSARSLTFIGKRYFAPGKGWHYSNTNYLVLGILAERVGRASLAHQYRVRFLEPVGLDHTYYQVVEKPRARLAIGYRFEGPGKARRPISLADGTRVMPFRSVVSAAGGAGSMAASSADLARWARALYDGEVLDPASAAAIIQDVMATAALKPAIPYGLGSQAIKIDGLATLGHSGRLLGSRAVMRYFTASGVSIAIVTNQSRSDPAPLLAQLALVAVPGATVPPLVP
jgi:D-alanyl-D-alanine carboxypeptidase